LSPFPKPIPDIKNYFYSWLLNNGKPFWPYWENINSWWRSCDNPNMCLLHYNELLHDTESVVKQLIQFLDLDVNQESLDKVLEYSTFTFMKQNAILTAPNGGKYWNNDGKGFYNKGKNGIWKDTLKIEEHNTISEIVSSKVGKECSTWLLR
jgi:aryl sulfotransferase